MKNHQWQDDFLADYLKSVKVGKRDFLLVAAVGGGKTRAALLAAKELRNNKRIKFIIVVTNTKHLVKQWERQATKVGLKFKKIFSNSELRFGVPSDVHGIVCTYQGLAYAPHLYEAISTDRSTLIIFDEIHHLGDKDEDTGGPKSIWGDAAKQAFSQSSFRLALSGTPFRTSGQRLPFIEYEEDKDDEGRFNGEFICKADKKFTYGQAVTHGICRRVVFKPFDASPDARQIEWTESGIVHKNSFSDPLADEKTKNDRLAAATDVSSNNEIISDLSKFKNQLVLRMLHNANQRLQDLRADGHPNAGGVVFCRNIDHANNVGKILKAMTGRRVEIVHDDDIQAAKRLDEFKDGVTPWIVSVKMVSEGVDIERLRVGVYLSNTITTVFFMQAMGRIVRYEKHPQSPKGKCYFYYPGDERLRAIADEVEKDIKMWVRDNKEQEERKGSEPPPRSKLELIFAAGEEMYNTVGGESFPPHVVNDVDEFCKAHDIRLNLDLDEAAYMGLLRLRQRAEQTQKHTEPIIEQTSYSEQNQEYRDKAQKLVGKLSYQTGKPHDHIHHEANKSVGIRNTETATLDQLKQKIAWLRDQIERK